jgi:hypothetical protein
MGRTDGEDVGEGDEHRSSGDVLGEPDGLVTLIAKMAVEIFAKDASAGDDIAASIVSADAFREAMESRDRLVPEGIATDAWARWLEGGPSVFPKGDLLRRPTVSDLSNIGVLKEHDQRSASVVREIEKTRQRLADLERRRRYHDAVSKATLQYLFLERVAKAVKPIFAMGPAWTVVRAIAFWREVPERAKGGIDAHRLAEYEILQHRYTYVSESTADVINRGLYLMMGDPEFEMALHLALYHHVRCYAEQIEARRKAAVKGGEAVDLDGRPCSRDDGGPELAGVFSGLLRRWRRGGRDNKGPWVCEPGDEGEHRDLEEGR